MLRLAFVSLFTVLGASCGSGAGESEPSGDATRPLSAKQARCELAADVAVPPLAPRDALPVAGSGADAYRYLIEFSKFGLKRSGTDGDEAVRNWVETELSAMGYEVSHEAIEFQRYVPRRYSLEAGEFAPCVFPLYHSGATTSEGLKAPLYDGGLGTPAELQGANGRIVLIDAPLVENFLTPTLDAARIAAAEAGALAVVVAAQGPENWVHGKNVFAGSGICGLPTLFVGKQDGAALRELAGTEALFILDAVLEERARTGNVLARREGQSDDVLVIGTPLNGWFTTAAERGGGVGAFLTLARQLAERDSLPQDLLFVATGGHEVGFLGLQTFIENRPELLPHISAYVHLGGSIAARGMVEVDGQVQSTGLAHPRLLFVSENPLLQAISEGAMRNNGVIELSNIPPASFNPGEQQYMYAAGVPIAAISASHFYFHSPRDLPDTTSAELLDPVVRGYGQIIDGVLALDAHTLRSANAVAGALANRAAEPGGCVVPPHSPQGKGTS